jgi:hypothetical protein
MIEIIYTNNEEKQIHLLEEEMTIADILYALNHIKKVRDRNRATNAKRIRPPTGRPVGRPRKSPPAPEIPPA